MRQRQAIQVAVVVQRTADPNPWEAWQFKLLEVLPDEGVFGPTVRCLHDDGKVSRWLHPGFTVELFADECKGYFLNLTSGRPAWFVSWLVDPADPGRVNLTAVSLSYIEADRRMTAEEVVEITPLDDELCAWLQAFTNEHFKPDTGRKVRAMSFLTPAEREQQAAQPLSNEALRTLFMSDPHFKQGDELNVRDDEVASVASSPLARQQKIRQARALGLLDDELLDQGLDAAANPSPQGQMPPPSRPGR